MTRLTPDPLDHLFAYHPPPNPGIAERHEQVRAAALEFARKIRELMPYGCEEFSHAIAHARQAMFWANAGIACYPEDATPDRLG